MDSELNEPAKAKRIRVPKRPKGFQLSAAKCLKTIKILLACALGSLTNPLVVDNSMTFLSPWCLLGLLPVVSVALWTLLHPTRELVVVPSLRLWQAAADDLSRPGKARTPRITTGWVLLLVGAVAAIFALTQPTCFTSAPARRIAIGLYCSGEFEGSPSAIRQAAESFIKRLGANDRIQLIYPDALGGAGGWMSVKQAMDELRAGSPAGAGRFVRTAAREMDLSSPAEDAQRTVLFVPAGANVPSEAGVSVVEVPFVLPPVTFDAVAAAPQAKGKAEVFFALRNQTAKAWSGLLCLDWQDDGGRVDQTVPLRIKPGEVFRLTRVVPVTGGLSAWLQDSAGNRVGSAAVLTPKDARRIRVALIGRDEPILRRYVESDPLLELVASAAQADVVIANGVNPPAGKAALVIDPPAPPVGWRKAAELRNILLDDADVAADAVLKDVALSALAVRRSTSWIAGDNATGIPLVQIDNRVVLLRTAPTSSPDRNEPPRLYVAFELS
ncbi:MAG: BatA domain-containing protein, partial [Candidatus Hydrogenedentes bacterium]|nr:BatA domain-containing protein [Candidatus Hydrogenedentota bacterium]